MTRVTYGLLASEEARFVLFTNRCVFLHFLLFRFSFEFKVLVIDPSTGNHHSISFDGMAKNITSVAFGGSDLKDLYVTSATHPEGEQLKGGHLFVVKNTGATGLPARNFKE